MFQGFLPINKPIGMRSAGCVERIKRILGRGVKVGHGGTLDSTASGVLVLLLGGVTRLSSFVMQMPKIYRAVMKLGAETTTCDYSGEPTIFGDAGGVTGEDIDVVLPSFMGWRMQVPPEVSAVHVGGRRAHEIFRSGGAPDLEPRPVFIESISRVGSLSEDGEAELLIRCGKGTYIRALVRDIGKRLGCRAHIASLRREAVGPFVANHALSLGESVETRDDIEASIYPIDCLGGFLARYAVGEDDERLLSTGREIPLSHATRETSGECCPDSTIFIVGNSFITIGGLKPSGGVIMIKPQINIENIHSPAGYPN
jgi:tRNA pseudouridine(55) synthase